MQEITVLNCLKCPNSMIQAKIHKDSAKITFFLLLPPVFLNELAPNKTKIYCLT